MRKIIVLLAFVGFSCVAFSQEEKRTSFDDWFYAELKAGFTSRQHNTYHHVLSSNLGYKFTNNFYGFIRSEYLLGVYRKDDVRTHFKSYIGGLGAGYQIFKSKNGTAALDLQAMIGTSIDSPDWKATVYEVGLALKRCDVVAPLFGISFRHANSRTTGIPDSYNVAFTIGVTL